MKQEPFAKIIELPHTQVLCFVEYDAEDDATVLRQIFTTEGGLRVEASMRFEGDNQEERAYQTLACIDKKAALILVQKMERALLEPAPREAAAVQEVAGG